jgi:phospholipase C
VFDEHGGFFDHVIPDPSVVSGMPTLQPQKPTALTKRDFLFDRYGFRVPAIVISPYVKQGTIDHTFHDHLSMAKTLSLIVQRSNPPLLDTPRFANATDFASLLTLSQPRKADDIHPCPHALPIEPPTRPTTINHAAAAFNTLDFPVQS